MVGALGRGLGRANSSFSGKRKARKVRDIGRAFSQRPSRKFKATARSRAASQGGIEDVGQDLSHA